MSTEVYKDRDPVWVYNRQGVRYAGEVCGFESNGDAWVTIDQGAMRTSLTVKQSQLSRRYRDDLKVMQPMGPGRVSRR